MAIQQVLWDWNGTLLNDVAYAMEVRNRCFPAFGLPCVYDVEEYRRQFTFPVRVYYERAGVTEDIFDAVAHAWMDEYVRGQKDVPLHPDALDTIDRLRAAGLRQAILSASQVDVLKAQLALYGLDNSFDAVLGLGDIYAGSKEALGRRYIAASHVPPEETVMVGDSLHDAEVARAMGTKCILVARGHQGKNTLLGAGVPVTNSLAEAADRIIAG